MEDVTGREKKKLGGVGEKREWLSGSGSERRARLG